MAKKGEGSHGMVGGLIARSVRRGNREILRNFWHNLIYISCTALQEFGFFVECEALYSSHLFAQVGWLFSLLRHL